jgi:hypothetical protein
MGEEDPPLAGKAAGWPMSEPLRLDALLGRAIYTADGRRLGRLEEFRAIRHDADWRINEYVIGTAGLVERLGLAARVIVGLRRRFGYVARWDQVDLSNPHHPRVRCPVDQLERL